MTALRWNQWIGRSRCSLLWKFTWTARKKLLFNRPEGPLSLCCNCSITVVLNRGSSPQGASMNFQGARALNALYNMERLINEFTNKYFRFHNLFHARVAWNKGQLLKGGVVEDRLRTTALSRNIDNVSSLLFLSSPIT